jgi:transcription antitermination factor NusG
MPILDAMPALWPEDVLEGTSVPAIWVALKVQPRCEKSVARALKDQALPYFLCLRSTTRMYQRRQVVSQTPLFAGYVFAAALDDEQLTGFWRLKHVSQVLRPPSQEVMVKELRDLSRLVSSGSPLTPEERLEPGQLARITRGCLEGLTGTVVHNRGGLRLVVAASFLGQGASIEVTPDMVQKV